MLHGNRIHKQEAPVGNLKVDYAATHGLRLSAAIVDTQR